MLINEPELPMSPLMLNGPVSNNLALPVNTTITLIIWPYNSYTLAGLNVNNNTMNYTETPWNSYIATITITNQTKNKQNTLKSKTNIILFDFD